MPLPFGPPGPCATHVAIDMQVFFSEGSEWAGPGTMAVAPNVARIAARAPQRTIFTRFMTPTTVAAARGRWQHYYRRWSSVLADRNAAAIYDLVAPLKQFVPPARVIDKFAHGAFEAPEFEPALAALDTDTIIATGVETDVCVMATVLTALDRGLRVIVVADACASSSEAGHRAALEAIFPRFDQQIEIADTATILRTWQV